MDYLVDFTLTVPEGTPASELEQRTTGEGARVAELAAEGHALRVWKPLPDTDALAPSACTGRPTTQSCKGSWSPCRCGPGWRSR